MFPEKLSVHEKIMKKICTEYLTGRITRTELADYVRSLASECSSDGWYAGDSDRSLPESLPDMWYDTEHNTVWVNSPLTGTPETLLFRNFDFSPASRTAEHTEVHSILMQPHERYSPAFFHSHDYYEIIYVTCGHCLNIFPDAVLELSADEVLFLPPGQVHTLSVFRDDCMVYNFLVRPEALLSILQPVPALSRLFSDLLDEDSSHQKGSSALRVTAGSELSRRVHRLWKDYVSLPAELRASFLFCGFEQLMILLAGLQGQKLQMTRLQAPGATKEQLLNCIKAECATITLGELAWRFGYNYEHISRIIQRQTGSSFAKLRRRCRMEKAANLLKNASLTIEQVMLECGYESRSSFFQNFKEEYGMTPGEYQKEFQPGSPSPYDLL